MKYSKSRILALISRIHSLSSEYTRKFLAEKGDYSSSHGFILYLLSCEPELSMGELTARINRDKSTTTALVKKLIDDGLIETFTSPSDSRKKLVRLTEKGSNFSGFTSEISSSLMNICWKSFTEEEKEKLLELLNRMKENLDEEQLPE